MREGERRPDTERENTETGKTPEPDRPKAESGKIPESWERAGEIPAEVGREVSSAKEIMAESFWGRAADFADSAAAKGLSPELGAFLQKFSGLNDRALASERLRSARERVAAGLRPAS